MNSNERIEFEIAVASKDSGSVLARRAVPASSLAAIQEELRFAAWRHSLDEDPRTIVVHEQVVFDPQLRHRLAGVRVVAQHDEQTWERLVGPELFQSSADRLTAELIRTKQIDAATEVHYWVEARVTASKQNGQATVSSRPTPLAEGRLEDYVSLSVRCGPVHEADYPVFVLTSALEQAHEYSWQGRTVEAGAWLVGRLLRQRRPHAEILGLIDTAIEARDATHEQTSLKLSTSSYRHFEIQLAHRRQQPGRDSDLAMGFYHSHPFLPSVLDDMEACPTCSLQSTCELTSSFFSTDDAQFHRSIFGHAPYTIQMVLGLTAREEFDLKMFCYRDGRFRERGYYRLSRLPETI